MVKTKALLDLAADARQHLLCIFTGDGDLRKIIEEAQITYAALLFREQARVLHGDGHLAGCRLHHFKVALAIDKLALAIKGRHHAHWPAIHHDWHGANALRWFGRRGQSEPCPHTLHVTAHQ